MRWIFILFLPTIIVAADPMQFAPFMRTATGTTDFLTIPELALWIDASRASMSNDVNNPIQEGNLVPGGDDLSLSNHTVAVYGDNPTWHSSGGAGLSKPYMTITNGGIGTLGSLSTSTTFTLVAVFRLLTRTGPISDGTFVGFNDTLNPFMSVDIGGTATFNDHFTNSMQMQNGGSFSSGLNSVTHSVWYIGTFVFDAASSLMRTNGVVLATGTVGTTAAPGGAVQFGGRSGSSTSYSSYDLMRALVWGRRLSADEITAVELQCNQDFAIY